MFMPRLLLGSLIMGICTVVAGCTASPQPPPPTAAALPARPVPVDGTYNGTTQLVRGDPISCGTQDSFTLRVANKAFHYVLNQPQVTWQPQRSFDVVIASDGAFQTQSGTAYIRGQLSQGHMQGEITGDACGYQFEADNTGTW